MACVEATLYPLLDIVGQVAEEVDAGELLQLLDGHAVILYLLVGAVFVGLVAPVAHGEILVLAIDVELAQHGCKEVLRHDELAVDALDDVLLVVDGTSLAHIDSVLGSEVVHPVAQLGLHAQPQAKLLLVA